MRITLFMAISSQKALTVFEEENIDENKVEKVKLMGKSYPTREEKSKTLMEIKRGWKIPLLPRKNPISTF
jgi:hypothetical protein